MLRVAESECPWGEMAANLRMQYLALSTQAVNCADRDEATELHNAAMRIALRLFGPAKE
jgi:hypothetical protein